MQMNQVTLPVDDLQAAVDFYLELGFLQIVDSPEYARFACEDDGPTFSLSLQHGTFKNGATIYFEMDDLDDKVAELQQRGVEFTQLPKDMSYLWREAELLDPCGNKVKLYQAGENRLYPPWRIERLRKEAS